MSVWHSVVDSPSFRRIAKGGPGRAVLRSRGARAVDTRRRAARAAADVRRNPHAFDCVQTFGWFVGHNKSGSSLLSALLDAHPDIACSDEVDLLRYVDAGFSRDELFSLVVRGAQVEARKGRVTARRLGGYSYAVPGWWQGRTRSPAAVCDTTTGTSTRRLGAHPDLLDRVDGRMAGVRVQLVQVIRNPFDPISVMMVRGGRSVENSVDAYFAACDLLVALRGRAGSRLLDVRYEDVVADPRRSVQRVGAAFGVTAPADYLDACAALVRPEPDRSRDLVPWTRPWIDTVQRRIDRYDFLDGYRHDDH
ncbi:MAG TPA: hypothetical protein VFZ17_02720 [Acidimicrobiia bacterium]|nr:hypothetical protein [Acidimicrobiia bacterium]